MYRLKPAAISYRVWAAQAVRPDASVKKAPHGLQKAPKMSLNQTVVKFGEQKAH
jgi:hypothetical protein